MGDGDRFDLVIRGLPRRYALRIGNKFTVEIALDELPNEVLTGPNGLFIRGLERQLQNATGGKGKAVAERTAEAWLAGFPTTRSAGASRSNRSAEEDARRKRTRREAEKLTLEVIRNAAAAATGDERMRSASRREIKRRMGDASFDQLAKTAESLAGGKAGKGK